MFDEIDKELKQNQEVTTQIGNISIFKQDANLVGKRVTRKKKGTALEWLVNQIMQEERYPRSIFENHETITLLESIPPNALVEVKLNHTKQQPIKHYKSICVYWNKKTNEGLMVYIPDVSQSEMESELFRNTL